MNILVSGAGIAGPTLAYWLSRYGFEPVLVEQAPGIRDAGYIVDFWGVGYDIAERMGILPHVLGRGYRVCEVRFVDANGRKIGGFSTEVIRRLASGRFTSLPRGELSKILNETIAGKVETLFADTITSLEQNRDGVRVQFAREKPRDFDLVIGADGLHSAVRRIAFGPDQRFEKRLGYSVAAFEAMGYRPRDELVYVGYTEPGRQVARFALRDDRTVFFFMFRDDFRGSDERDERALLHRVFGAAAWECPQILAAMDRCDTLYFDRVSQIRMRRWTEGRVALVGDAAFCVSLLAGEGAGLAMAAAYVLAGELDRAAGDHVVACARYEQCLRDFIGPKQKSAEGFASWFAPRTQAGLLLRNISSRLLSFPPLAEVLIGRSLRDEITLPDYEPRAATAERSHMGG